MVAILLVSVTAFAATPGTFRGIVYRGANTRPGWVYVVGRHDSMRLVEVGHATVSYAEEFPGPQRFNQAARELRPGAEVRVTAEQDDHGNWRATEIEIINPAARTKRRQPGHGTD